MASQRRNRSGKFPRPVQRNSESQVRLRQADVELRCASEVLDGLFCTLLPPSKITQHEFRSRRIRIHPQLLPEFLTRFFRRFRRHRLRQNDSPKLVEARKEFGEELRVNPDSPAAEFML